MRSPRAARGTIRTAADPTAGTIFVRTNRAHRPRDEHHPARDLYVHAFPDGGEAGGPAGDEGGGVQLGALLPSFQLDPCDTALRVERLDRADEVLRVFHGRVVIEHG